MPPIIFNHDRLKTLREMAGLSHEAFAKKIGVSAMSPKNWESGKTSPRVSDLTNIFNTFNVDPSAFWRPVNG